MRTLAIALAVAFGLTLAATSAEAGSRITCQCKTGKKTWIMGTYACEHGMNKPWRTTLYGSRRPAKYCTSRENEAFRSKLCAEECAGN